MSTRRSLLAVTLPGVAVALLVLGSTASAQTQSLFGGTGGTGGAAAGAAGGGTAAAANTQAGAFESGGPQLTTELGSASQSAGQSTFLGRGAGTAMVGNAGAQGAAAAGGQSNIPDFSAGGGGGGRGGNGGGGNGNQTRQSVIRPVLRIAFDYPRIPAVTVDTNLRARVTKVIEQRPEFAGVEFRVDDTGNTVVTGIVQSQADADLAMALARLEPGVRKVEGDLAIQTPPVPSDR